MTNPQNKKVRMTKLLLKKSLFEYLAEKPITELNVRMICNKAQINRSTFYLHYKSIDDMLNSIKDKISCIKGNCDSEVDEMVLEFPFVKESIIVFPSFKIFLTHGHIINKDNMPMLSKGDILLYGHTHIPMWHTDNNGIRIFNPGSVSIPKNNSKHSYMTLDEKCAIWKDVQTMDEYHKEILL